MTNPSAAIPFRKVEMAYEFVSAGPLHAHRALLDRTSGDVLLQSDAGHLDEFPAVVDQHRFLAIPTRSELHLGKTLVLAFVAAHAAERMAEVRDMFGTKGAYPRFKDFLDRHLLVDRWYEFEGRETEKALREWCTRVRLPVSG